MLRSFTPSDIVQLPRTSVNDGLALGAAMLSRAAAAAAAAKLPPALDKAHTRLESAYEQLRASVRQRLQESGGTSAELRVADRALDSAWVATYQWSLGWSRLPPLLDGASPHEAAIEIQNKLFTDGVRFTQYRYRDEWVESQMRMDIIESHGLEAQFTALGGAAILACPRHAHAAYGRSLGITAIDDGDTGPLPGEALRVFLDQLRRYVIQVSAHADSDDEAAAALAEDLLAPLTTFRATPAASPGGDGTSPAPGAPDTPDLPPDSPNDAAAGDTPADVIPIDAPADTPPVTA